jgi:16S rRNA (adenine1518-N6/adenine1519-N6)-dimethyltransferase
MKFKKSLGQNLLIDKNILKKITSLTSFKNKEIIEIGAGTGNLSSEILKLFPKKLTCIEKDKNFTKNLKIFFKNEKNISIINDDILKINLKKLMSNETIVIGNLPYNISTQILIKFLKLNPWPPKFIKMIFMFQKEVGEKIIANFGSKEYSRLSIITKSRLRILNYFYVSKNCFIPKPKVDSIVIEFEPIVRKDLNFKSIESLEYITNVFFSNRRKMINKTFKKLKIYNDKFLQNNSIDLALRPEKLSENLYYKITEYYEKRTK